MTAIELKRQYLKASKVKVISVIGKLDAVVKDGCDHYYHIHDDEQIPQNVHVLLRIKQA